MGIHCNEIHDTLSVVTRQVHPRELDQLVELIHLGERTIIFLAKDAND